MRTEKPLFRNNRSRRLRNGNVFRIVSDAANVVLSQCRLLPFMGALIFLAGPADARPLRNRDVDVLIEPGDRLVVCGDSISAMSKYTVLMDLYFAACRPDLMVDFYQDAISGERTERFLRRLDGTLERAQPSFVISFYGWNDGGWTAFQQENADRYEADTRELIRRFHEAGVPVLIGSTSAAGPNLEIAEEYNRTLGRFRDIAQRLTEDTGTAFIDVHAAVLDAQQRMRARLGEDYDIIGRDGAHADWPAHMAIATAFLRRLGLGQEPLALIEWDAANGEAVVGDGHEIVAVEDRALTVESSRFPFLFFWNHPPGVLRDMALVAMEIGFFDDLNRFMLVVKGLPDGIYDLAWGTTTRTFSASELSKGINLAEHFQRTPFDGTLQQLWPLSMTKCMINATLVIDAVHNRKNLADHLPQIVKILGDANPDTDFEAVVRDQPSEVLALFAQYQREIGQSVRHVITLSPKDQ